MTTHHDDAERLEQIERLINEGIASDDPVANQLRRYRPVASPAHMHTLEQEILTMEPSSHSEKPKKKPNRARYGMMGAAAVAMLAVGGMVFLLAAAPMRGTSYTETMPTVGYFDPFLLTATVVAMEGGAYQVTALPTATPMLLSLSDISTPTPFSFVTPIPVAAQGDIVRLDADLLRTVNDAPFTLRPGTQLALYTRLQLDGAASTDAPLLVSDQIIVVNLPDTGDVELYVPAEQLPIVTWLIANAQPGQPVFYIEVRSD